METAVARVERARSVREAIFSSFFLYLWISNFFVLVSTADAQNRNRTL